MEEAVLEVLPDGSDDFEVAIASVDPTSGAVRAFIGGPEFADFQFNLVTQGSRQPDLRSRRMFWRQQSKKPVFTHSTPLVALGHALFPTHQTSTMRSATSMTMKE